jgi:DNA end-binding protein Ku
MRTLWTGTLSFGLVSIPIRLYTATDDKSPSFNQLRTSDHSRIGYQRVAKADGEPVEYEDIVKGYEYEPGRYVVFDGDELEALEPESSRTVEIHQFVPRSQIDPLYFQRSYYLAPDKGGAKAYSLLSQAMREGESVALCKITLRDKEHLATLRLHDDVLVLETMYWPDEIREFTLADAGIDELPEARPQEVQMARTLIENLTEDFDPERYSDEYRERVLEAVRAKIEGEEVAVPTGEGAPAPVVDLAEALKQSVEATRQRRGKGGKAAAS